MLNLNNLFTLVCGYCAGIFAWAAHLRPQFVTPTIERHRACEFQDKQILFVMFLPRSPNHALTLSRCGLCIVDEGENGVTGLPKQPQNNTPCYHRLEYAGDGRTEMTKALANCRTT
jgi:hypothetical protein